VTDNVGGRSAWEDDDAGPFEAGPFEPGPFEQGDQDGGGFGQTEGSTVQGPGPYGKGTDPYGPAAGPYGQETGTYNQETGTYSQGTGTYGQAAGTFADTTGTFGDPTSPFGQGGGPSGSRKPSRNAIIAIAAAVVVLIGGGVGAAVALSSHNTTTANGPTTTIPTSPASTSPAITSPATTSPPQTSPSTSGNSALLSNAPFTNCTDLPAAQRGIPDATDEVICTGSDVANDGGAQAFYATLPSPTVAEEYLATLSHQGSPNGQCSDIQLGPGSALCDFTDSSSESGLAAMYIGTNFNFGPNSTTEANCTAEGQPSSDGTAVLVFNYSGSDVVGGAFACDASVTPLATIRSSLYNSDFELENQ
jgi:hypothetical protein